MTQITIALAKKEDALHMVDIHYRAVHAINNEYYSESLRQSWSPKPTSSRVEWLQGVISNGNTCCICAKRGSEVVGFAILLFSEQCIQAVYVDPGHCGYGIATRLMMHLEEIAKQKHIRHLWLNGSLNALGFYLHLGYQIHADAKQALANGDELECKRMHKQL